MPRRGSLALLAALALVPALGGCRPGPDNSVGRACVKNASSVGAYDCYLTGKEQGGDDGASASNAGYEDGYQACLDEQDSEDTADTGG